MKINACMVKFLLLVSPKCACMGQNKYLPIINEIFGRDGYIFLYHDAGYNYTDGPFLIRCVIDDKSFYWRVDDFHNVRAEECEATEATHFYIKPRSHPEHGNDFYIVYFESETKKHADPFVPHYLQRSVPTVPIIGSRARGGSHQQLKFGLYSHDKDTPLSLYKEEGSFVYRYDYIHGISGIIV